jgi:hypothetical protein
MNRQGLVTWSAAVVIAGLAGYGLGRVTVGDGHRQDRAISARTLPSHVTQSSPPRLVHASVVRSGRSAPAAVAAAARYLDALSSAPRVGGAATVRALTTGGLTPRALRAAAVGALIARRLSARGPVFMRGWLVGYRIVAAARDRVRVAVWTMGLLASQQEVVEPQWSTTLCTLIRVAGAWKLTDARTTAGPTPPEAGSSPSKVAGFVRAASGFRELPGAA